MAGLGQGHETANQSYQTDGLRDTDVLASPTLTNLNERGLMNGVVPIVSNDYNSGSRNASQTGNCQTFSPVPSAAHVLAWPLQKQVPVTWMSAMA